MEKRICNLIVQSPGGSAAKGASTYKISLPTTWIQEMGLDKDNRQLELSFDGETIHIRKIQDIQDFLEEGKRNQHKLLLLSFYHEDTLCTEIAANYDRCSICVKNHTGNILWSAFGKKNLPSWEDYQEFLESRCIPRQRAGLQYYLETLGLDAYDPLAIIRKTEGRMAEDSQWLRVEEVK